MNNPFQKFIKKYFPFQKSDRNAVLVLSILILFSFIVQFIVSNLEPKSKYKYADYAECFKIWEDNKTVEEQVNKYLFDFDPNVITEKKLDSLLIPKKVKENLLKYRKAGGKFSNAQQLQKVYGMNDSIFSVIEKYIRIQNIVKKNPEKEIDEMVLITGFFDPNYADSKELRMFGFKAYQIDNLLKFRSKGGVFHQKNDVLKIYGVDSLFFSSIEKYIQISPIEKNEATKLKTEFIVEINNADTSELKQLKGIGSVFAKRILKYRDLLGGYYSTEQLREVYNFPIEILPLIENQIIVDTLRIKKIRINFAEYRDLLKHPYFNKKQVEAILEYRNKNGTFDNLNQLELIPEIDSLSLAKIKPYITCR